MYYLYWVTWDVFTDPSQHRNLGTKQLPVLWTYSVSIFFVEFTPSLAKLNFVICSLLVASHRRNYISNLPNKSTHMFDMQLWNSFWYCEYGATRQYYSRCSSALIIKPSVFVLDENYIWTNTVQCIKNIFVFSQFFSWETTGLCSEANHSAANAFIKTFIPKTYLTTELFEHWAPSIWQHFSFISMSDCVKHCIIHLPPQSLFFLRLARFEELCEFSVCVSLGLLLAICWNGLIYWIYHIISVFYPELVKY